MVKKNLNSLILCYGLALFVLLIALAIVFESAYLLYAASVLPIIIVPFLPDIPAGQWLKPSDKSGFRLYRTTPQAGDPSGFVIIECRPGSIRWNRSKLYFSLEGIPVQPANEDINVTSLPVLAYDLSPHRRRKNSYCIHLKHLLQRTAALAIEPDNVTRLMIRLEDLQQFQRSKTLSSPSTVGKGLQA